MYPTDSLPSRSSPPGGHFPKLPLSPPLPPRPLSHSAYKYWTDWPGGYQSTLNFSHGSYQADRT